MRSLWQVMRLISMNLRAEQKKEVTFLLQKMLFLLLLNVEHQNK